MRALVQNLENENSDKLYLLKTCNNLYLLADLTTLKSNLKRLFAISSKFKDFEELNNLLLLSGDDTVTDDSAFLANNPLNLTLF